MTRRPRKTNNNTHDTHPTAVQGCDDAPVLKKCNAIQRCAASSLRATSTCASPLWVWTRYDCICLKLELSEQLRDQHDGRDHAHRNQGAPANPFDAPHGGVSSVEAARRRYGCGLQVQSRFRGSVVACVGVASWANQAPVLRAG